jgi:hypothetical protein
MKSAWVLALLWPVLAADASEWVTLGKVNDGSQETFIDTASIRVDGDLRRGWLKLVSAPHTLTGVAGGPEKWVDYQLRREAFRCRDEYHRSEGLIVFFDDHTSFTTSSKLFPSAWEPGPPDTAASVVMQFICSYVKPVPPGSAPTAPSRPGP